MKLFINTAGPVQGGEELRSIQMDCGCIEIHRKSGECVGILVPCAKHQVIKQG